MLNSFFKNDGRKTMKQEIEHVQVNNPDVLAPYGEWSDNSESWGNATIGGIVITKDRSVIIDNGIFDRDIFPKTFTMNKDSTMERYENDLNKLGKFNAGSTESVMLIGTKATLLHNFSGTILKTTLDLDRVARDNNLNSNEEKASVDEKNDFIKYQQLIKQNYNIDEDRGTVLIVEGLRKPNTINIFNQIKEFMTGLYSPKRPKKINWYLYNWVNENWPSIRTPIIIEPNDLSFNCLSDEITIYVYENDGETLYLQNKTTFYGELLYQFTINTYFFEQLHIDEENKLFTCNTVEDRVGFLIRRANRLLTGIKPKRWNLSTGMNRAKGIRIIIDIPAHNNADKDWCIGTFKKITDDTWVNFNSKLQEFLSEFFKDTNAIKDKIHKKKQNEFIRLYESRLNEIDETWSLEIINSHLDIVKYELKIHLTHKDILKKKSGRAFNSINNYIKKLELVKINKSPPTPPQPTPKSPQPTPKSPQPTPNSPQPRPKSPQPRPKSPLPTSQTFEEWRQKLNSNDNKKILSKWIKTEYIINFILQKEYNSFQN